MRRTSIIKSPVLSFFAPSPASSRRAQEALQTLFSLEPLTLKSEEDELDQTLVTPGFGRTVWDSVALKCGSSGSLIHLLSPTNGKDTPEPSPLSLLSVTGHQNQSDNECVQESRQHIAANFKANNGGLASSLKRSIAFAMGKPLMPSDILASNNGLPVLSLPEEPGIEKEKSRQSSGLKEMIIPFYDESAYLDGSSLLSNLSDASHLSRPAVGLYQWPFHGVAIRPLPAALEDRSLSPPSLVFRCSDLDQVSTRLSDNGVRIAKIGFGGLENQLMILHPDLMGIDIRLTNNFEYSSAFPEAQQSLMAASLEELQNPNVLMEDGSKGKATTSTSQTDSSNGMGDCWMEVRANLKRPSGYLRNPRKSTMRTAKPPDIPYE